MLISLLFYLMYAFTSPSPLSGKLTDRINSTNSWAVRISLHELHTRKKEEDNLLPHEGSSTRYSIERNENESEDNKNLMEEGDSDRSSIFTHPANRSILQPLNNTKRQYQAPKQFDTNSKLEIKYFRADSPRINEPVKQTRQR